LPPARHLPQGNRHAPDKLLATLLAEKA